MDFLETWFSDNAKTDNYRTAGGRSIINWLDKNPTRESVAAVLDKSHSAHPIVVLDVLPPLWTLLATFWEPPLEILHFTGKYEGDDPLGQPVEDTSIFVNDSSAPPLVFYGAINLTYNTFQSVTAPEAYSTAMSVFHQPNVSSLWRGALVPVVLGSLLRLGQRAAKTLVSSLVSFDAKCLADAVMEDEFAFVLNIQNIRVCLERMYPLCSPENDVHGVTQSSVVAFLSKVISQAADNLGTMGNKSGAWRPMAHVPNWDIPRYKGEPRGRCVEGVVEVRGVLEYNLYCMLDLFGRYASRTTTTVLALLEGMTMTRDASDYCGVLEMRDIDLAEAASLGAIYGRHILSLGRACPIPPMMSNWRLSTSFLKASVMLLEYRSPRLQLLGVEMFDLFSRHLPQSENPEYHKIPQTLPVPLQRYLPAILSVSAQTEAFDVRQRILEIVRNVINTFSWEHVRYPLVDTVLACGPDNVGAACALILKETWMKRADGDAQDFEVVLRYLEFCQSHSIAETPDHISTLLSWIISISLKYPEGVPREDFKKATSTFAKELDLAIHTDPKNMELGIISLLLADCRSNGF